MEDLTQIAGPVEVGARGRSSRVLAAVAVLALVLGGLALARHAATPLQTDKIVNNVDRSTPFDGVGGVLGRSLGFGAAPAQISVSALVCPILNALVAQIPFLAPILQPLRVSFGCISA